MISHDFDLNAISVRKPCHEDWDAMTGDDRARFCGKCEKKVYNLSEMTEHEAKALILEKRGDLCVQFYRRADGTLATASCPTGFLGGPRRKLARAAAAAVAAGTMIAGSAFAGGNDRTTVANGDAAQAAAALRAQHAQVVESCEAPVATPETTVTYTVREGDTLADILAQWNSREQWVRAANPDADLSTLKAGQKLRVPYAQVAVKGKVAVSSPASTRLIKGDMAAPPVPTTPAPAAPMMRGEMVAPAPRPTPPAAAGQTGGVVAPGGPVVAAPASDEGDHDATDAPAEAAE